MAISTFGVSLSYMTVWRDLQAQANLLEKRRQDAPVRVLGLGGAYPKLAGKKRLVLVAVDMGNGHTVAVGKVDEANPQAVKRFLEPWVKRLWVSVIVTDDLNAFRVVAEKLTLEQQVCQLHKRSWVERKRRSGQSGERSALDSCATC